MANLTQGIPLKITGNDAAQRRVYLPVAANASFYESSFVVQGSGALVAATTASDTSTVVAGVSEADVVGGASNGAVRASILNNREFTCAPGGNTPPTDATPFGTAIYADTDHTGGTVNTGSALPRLGYFVGMDQDGVNFRVFVPGY